MYLRSILSKNNGMSFLKMSSKRFSLLDRFGLNTLSYRMTKYDPTKELEVS
jgi:hypothetical protein